MRKDQMDGAWPEIAQLIHMKWGKLTKKEVDSLKGDLDGLAKKVQQAYGCARGQAEIEYHEFQLSLRPILMPIRNRTTR